jgi:peptidoglycan hydrolase-like protein with peptidoglycan-binding domain
MKKFVFVLFVSMFVTASVWAQATAAPAGVAPAAKSASLDKPKKQIFRANKDQVTQAQKMLKGKGVYAGEATGKLDDPTRESIKNYQKVNGLKDTGTLNRATLEKMGIELTDKQKLIPASPNSYASSDAKPSDVKTANGAGKPRHPIFRATKDQIMDAQKLLKSKGMYSGDETGKLDDATREGLKKFQEASSIKVTGTLNQATLEKMGIELTEKQKGDGGLNK